MYYTLIAYQPSGVDTCMGCVMERFPSDFQWLTTENRKEAVDFYAARSLEDRRRNPRCPDFDFIFLIDGAECSPYDSPYKEIVEEAKAIVTDRETQRIRLEAEKKRKSDELKADQQRQQELQLLATLRAKYDKSHP